MKGKPAASIAKRSRRKRPMVRSTLDDSMRAPVRLTRAQEARLDAMTDADIARAIASDPDTLEFTDEMFAKATWVEPVLKQQISVRIDRDVLDWFRATGRNYQTRMNAVLRGYVSHHKGRARKRT